MRAATLARIVAAQRQREALAVVTRLADGAQCLVDASGCSGELERFAATGRRRQRRCSPPAAVRR